MFFKKLYKRLLRSLLEGVFICAVFFPPRNWQITGKYLLAVLLFSLVIAVLFTIFDKWVDQFIRFLLTWGVKKKPGITEKRDA